MKLNSVWIVRLTVVLTALIGLAAFILSFSAVRALAASNNVPDNLAWLFPLLADAVVIVAGLSVIGQHMEGESTRYQWLLVALFTILSIVLNFLHAPDNWTARGLSVVPPIALFLTFELLSVQIQRAAKRSEKRDTLAQLDQQIEQLNRNQAALEQTNTAARAKLEKDMAERRSQLTADMSALEQTKQKLIEDIEHLRTDKRKTRKGQSADTAKSPGKQVLNPVQRREMIRRDIRTANGHGAPAAETLAEKYQVSVKTIRRDLGMLESEKAGMN